ncbi:uncharacterized protein FOMMEDRAFT_163560 [Fomitiporia mediterranea MF3/22]|uniref:Zn(2)-C6 fungal-type domain-containing protein n=1 Tax=Fomitiporia mediterranea (strain MF3/22) TaxID=694068 RepID=R7SFC1_FOMME|nr:uncharacterized protein FOMMEDRAFT_163560 [Fomitiporia mediterranea MF3/22]EJC97403.1 hypothetical protein FOMMEDRAFT_163560 [Fomitiporia mediterranea MF3/22]
MRLSPSDRNVSELTPEGVNSRTGALHVSIFCFFSSSSFFFNHVVVARSESGLQPSAGPCPKDAGVAAACKDGGSAIGGNGVEGGTGAVAVQSDWDALAASSAQASFVLAAPQQLMLQLETWALQIDAEYGSREDAPIGEPLRGHEDAMAVDEPSVAPPTKQVVEVVVPRLSDVVRRTVQDAETGAPMGEPDVPPGSELERELSAYRAHERDQTPDNERLDALLREQQGVQPGHQNDEEDDSSDADYIYSGRRRSVSFVSDFHETDWVAEEVENGQVELRFRNGSPVPESVPDSGLTPLTSRRCSSCVRRHVACIQEHGETIACSACKKSKIRCSLAKTGKAARDARSRRGRTIVTNPYPVAGPSRVRLEDLGELSEHSSDDSEFREDLELERELRVLGRQVAAYRAMLDTTIRDVERLRARMGAKARRRKDGRKDGRN